MRPMTEGIELVGTPPLEAEREGRRHARRDCRLTGERGQKRLQAAVEIPTVHVKDAERSHVFDVSLLETRRESPRASPIDRGKGRAALDDRMSS